MATGIEVAIAYGITKGAISALAKPVATATFSGLKSIASGIPEIFENRLTEYVNQQAEKHSCLSTIVFQHQKSLHDLYVPLTVLSTKESWQEETKNSILLDRFKEEFLPQNNRVLITDTAGMGKSTLSKFLFLQCLKSAYAIPFFVELRHLSDKLNILDVLYKQLNPISVADEDPKFTKRQVQRMLKKNSLIFFLDGYDEIAPDHREIVTRGIKDLIENYPQHNYVITSRPESGLLAFPSFKQYKIRPLKLDESFSLIRRYGGGDGRAEQLIEKLGGREFKSVHEFLKNPMLTSLLFRSFEYKQSIPLKKHVFYRQVFDALFDWHDATKDGYNTREKKSGLDIDTFHRMLKVIGFYSVVKGQVEGDTDTVLAWIRKAKEICNITSLAESHFLEDLIRAVPVFVKDGDQYRWAHKSLSEYFAAQYICTDGKGQQQKILSTFVSSRQITRFENVLDQVYDIDNSGFREHLILPVAKAFTKYCEESYKNMDPSIPDEDVRLRRACSFDREIIFLNDFEFQDFKSLKNKLNDATKTITGHEVNFDAAQLNIDGDLSTLVAFGSYCEILSILAMKKDPLVMSRNTLATRISQSGKVPRPKSPTSLNDDPGTPYNSFQNFSKVTAQIASMGVVPNYEKLHSYEKNFNDLSVLSSFADELLSPLIKPA